ncbi:haloacid dehalogenase [Curtobacterium oceanosedimentum]|uniref:Haloacid dehalogenase n=1 Tax=Curtobacterium oceanosedimentum TaxID=465820 RepID=A0ABR5S8M3_9MICO|nr:HAD hydrolase-like protein [Curtobacterium oceanosedimentum]KTR41665.1 haloacid dehalogenase [Curtobacterium oceanosedimentum]
MTDQFSVALFDLDGTINDSAPGIASSMSHAFEQMGATVPTPEVLLSFVGPPILESFQVGMGMDSASARHCLTLYNSHYGTHGLSPRLYAGIDEALQLLYEWPIPIATATSKPESLATAILQASGISGRFAAIVGASEDEARCTKADVIAEALARLQAAGHDVTRPVLIGDRIHDVEGAAAHGVPVIFAEWGYGSIAESEGAIATAATPSELPSLILGLSTPS